ncbi:MAG TPA: NfeD family protein [Opitutaceae bacterium]|nr:NfeD family protein [Opitutaceae bacterium]
MTLVIVLFVLGALLLALEIIVPGGVLGSIGGLLMLGGVVAAFLKLGTTGGGVATGLALLLLGTMFYLEMVWLPRSRVAKHLTMDATIDSVSQPPVAQEAEVLGQDAVALSTLAPTGFVRVNGRRYEASCRSGYAAAGETLKVVGLDAFRLIVTKP